MTKAKGSESEETEGSGAGDEGTHPPEVPRCRWCRRVLPARSGPGRRREFCRQACRQWDWVARQRAAELELSEDELVMARSELDRLHDDLYVLACAVEDTERDLGGSPSKGDLEEMLKWLLEAAKPLRDREISASAGRR